MARAAVPKTEALERRAKVLTAAAQATGPLSVAQLQHEAGVEMGQKRFSALLYRLVQEGHLKRATEPTSHTQATYVRANGAEHPTAVRLVAGRQPRKKKKGRRIVSNKDARVQAAAVRAKVIATLSGLDAPALARELFDSIPEARAVYKHVNSFSQVLDRMRENGLISHVKKKSGGHLGYVLKATPSSVRSNAARTWKRKEKAEQDDVGLVINQADASMAFNLGGKRVTVKVV